MRNKSILIGVIAMLAIAVAGVAYAITTVNVKPGQPIYSDGIVVQNNTATAPNLKGSVCVTKAIHHAGAIQTFNLYTSNSWYKKADWTVVNSSTGTPFVVQRKLGANATGMPASNGSIAVNRGYASYTISTFGNNTSASLTMCQDRE